MLERDAFGLFFLAAPESPWHDDSARPHVHAGSEARRLYRAGKASPLEVMRAVLDRVDRVNPQVSGRAVYD